MGIATRGYTYCIVFFGAVSLLLGIGAIICSGLLSNMVAGVRITEEHSTSAIFSAANISVFEKYWWFTFYVSQSKSFKGKCSIEYLCRGYIQ